MNTTQLVTTDIELIKDTVARGLWVSIKNARGSCVYLTPAKVLRLAKSPYGGAITRSVVRHVLDELAKRRYIEFIQRTTRKEYVYCIHRDTQLWTFIKQCNGPEDVRLLLDRIV